MSMSWSRAEVHLFLSGQEQRKLLQWMILEWIARGCGLLRVALPQQGDRTWAWFTLERVGWKTTLRILCSGICDPVCGTTLPVFISSDFLHVSDMGQSIARVQLQTGHLVLGQAQKLAMFESSTDAGGVNANQVHHRHISLKVDGETAADRLRNVAAKAAQVWLLAYERLWLALHAEYAPRPGVAEDFVEFTAAARALLADDEGLGCGALMVCP
jgi:hypothetical protein